MGEKKKVLFFRKCKYGKCLKYANGLQALSLGRRQVCDALCLMRRDEHRVLCSEHCAPSSCSEHCELCMWFLFRTMCMYCVIGLHDQSVLCQPLFFWIYCKNIYLSRSFVILALSRTVKNILSLSLLFSLLLLLLLWLLFSSNTCFFLTQLKMVLIMRYIIIIVLLLLFGWLVVCITTEKANKIGQEWNLQKGNFFFWASFRLSVCWRGLKDVLTSNLTGYGDHVCLQRGLPAIESSPSQGDDFHFLNFFANTIPQVLTDFSTMICQL